MQLHPPHQALSMLNAYSRDRAIHLSYFQSIEDSARQMAESERYLPIGLIVHSVSESQFRIDFAGLKIFFEFKFPMAGAFNALVEVSVAEWEGDKKVATSFRFDRNGHCEVKTAAGQPCYLFVHERDDRPDIVLHSLVEASQSAVPVSFWEIANSPPP